MPYLIFPSSCITTSSDLIQVLPSVGQFSVLRTPTDKIFTTFWSIQTLCQTCIVSHTVITSKNLAYVFICCQLYLSEPSLSFTIHIATSLLLWSAWLTVRDGPPGRSMDRKLRTDPMVAFILIFVFTFLTNSSYRNSSHALNLKTSGLQWIPVLHWSQTDAVITYQNSLTNPFPNKCLTAWQYVK